MKADIVLIPGDGIGPEIVGEAKKVLEHVAEKFGHSFPSRRSTWAAAPSTSTGSP